MIQLSGWTATRPSPNHLKISAGPLEVFTVSINDNKIIYNKPYHEYRKFDTVPALLHHIHSRLDGLDRQYRRSDNLWIALDKLADLISRMP